jgi:hypothetical protein
MTDRLRTHWFEFDLALGEACPRGARIGAGVTAFDTDDAIALLRSRVFTDGTMPPIKLAVKNVDPRTLDPWLVLENMLPPTDRGVWFPAVRSAPPGPGIVSRLRELLRSRGDASRHVRATRSDRAERRGVSGNRH